MKKVCIVTMYNDVNFGNRLQNYALQETLKKIGVEPETIKNGDLNILSLLKKNIKKCIHHSSKIDKKRQKEFKRFCGLINSSKKTVNWNSKKLSMSYDYYITGSDQVWNPQFNSYNRLRFYLLGFTQNDNKISYAASFGQDSISEEYKKLFSNELKKFKTISVREDKGREIINKIDSSIKSEVLVDPTMLLDKNDWNKVITKPKEYKEGKYILLYFLGKISKEKMEKINIFASENNCKIINVMDKNSPLYSIGPDNFLYLIKNAFLICTDSFHASVFSIIFDRPFVVFDREQKELKSMNSRIDTLLSRFHIIDRKYNGNMITKKNIMHNYTEAYKILIDEQKKSKMFLEKALDIRGED